MSDVRDKVRLLKPVGGEDDPWDAIMRDGATAALLKVLAKRPLSVTIIFEERDGQSYAFECFPPGQAASWWMFRALVEVRMNADEAGAA